MRRHIIRVGSKYGPGRVARMLRPLISEEGKKGLLSANLPEHQ